jgi:hypothetical protein
MSPERPSPLTPKDAPPLLQEKINQLIHYRWILGDKATNQNFARISLSSGDGRSSVHRLLHAHFSQDQYKSETITKKLIKQYERQHHQSPTEDQIKNLLESKRCRQIAALKGSLTKASDLIQRQQAGETLDYFQRKKIAQMTNLVNCAVAGIVFNQDQFNLEYRNKYGPPPKLFSKEMPPLPVAPEPPQPRPTRPQTETIKSSPASAFELPKPESPPNPQTTLDLSLQKDTLRLLDKQITSADKKISHAAASIAEKRRRLQRSDPDFHQSINSVQADLTSEKRRVAQTLLQLSQDHELVLPQSAPVPSTFAHKLRSLFRGPSTADISSKIFANFQQGSELFSDFFTLDNSNPQNIHLVFNRSAAEKFLAENPNQRRKLLLATAAVATTAALKLASETPLGHQVVDQVKKEAGESLDQLQAKFRSWWQERLAKIWHPNEKVAIPGEWLDPYAEPFFQTGNEVLHQTGADFYRFLLNAPVFTLTPKENFRPKLKIFPTKIFLLSLLLIILNQKIFKD